MLPALKSLEAPLRGTSMPTYIMQRTATRSFAAILPVYVLSIFQAPLFDNNPAPRRRFPDQQLSLATVIEDAATAARRRVRPRSLICT